MSDQVKLEPESLDFQLNRIDDEMDGCFNNINSLQETASFFLKPEQESVTKEEEKEGLAEYSSAAIRAKRTADRLVQLRAQIAAINLRLDR